VLGESVLVRGAVGVGTSTTVWMLHEILMDAEIPHAALDLDWVSASWPRCGPWNSALRLANTAAVAANHRSRGIVNFAVAVPVIAERLRDREDAESLPWFLERAAVLHEQFESDGLDDLVIDASRPARDVATELAVGLSLGSG
jgi:hypothetical protein